MWVRDWTFIINIFFIFVNNKNMIFTLSQLFFFLLTYVNIMGLILEQNSHLMLGGVKAETARILTRVFIYLLTTGKQNNYLTKINVESPE